VNGELFASQGSMLSGVANQNESDQSWRKNENLKYQIDGEKLKIIIKS
jgi:hypothetical protein